MENNLIKVIYAILIAYRDDHHNAFASFVVAFPKMDNSIIAYAYLYQIKQTRRILIFKKKIEIFEHSIQIFSL